MLVDSIQLADWSGELAACSLEANTPGHPPLNIEKGDLSSVENRHGILRSYFLPRGEGPCL